MQVETSKPVAAIGCKVAIITSSYHQEITSSLARGAETSFLEAGGIAENCMHIQAAGAWELPILAKQVINSKNADAVIALGCIITGETTHDQVIGYAIAHASWLGVRQTCFNGCTYLPNDCTSPSTEQ